MSSTEGVRSKRTFTQLTVEKMHSLLTHTVYLGFLDRFETEGKHTVKEADSRHSQHRKLPFKMEN